MSDKLFLRACAGEVLERPPLWLMRQAGRYLPEYREIRAKAKGFLDFCYSPALAAEATVQPIRRYGFDAAILFSDILVVPDALGQGVRFVEGEGPQLDPIEDEAGFARLHEALDLNKLAPVLETVDRVKGMLPRETAFIGFCGAPWTVASYMIAGHGTPDQAPARLFAYRYPALFQRLIDLLVTSSIAYLDAQIKAGVEVVQIFDSWAGVLPGLEFERWCLEPMERIAAAIKALHPTVRVIAFPRQAVSHLRRFAQRSSADVIGLDTACDPVWSAEAVQDFKVVQGNLDPLALIAGGQALEEQVRHIRSALGRGGHIFNLGHGILPQTPLAHVEKLVKLVRL